MKRIFIVFIALLHITAICRGDVCPVGYQPVEYEELEYIESTGIQWIDTGFVPNQDTRTEIKVKVNNAQNFHAGIFGSGSWTTNDGFRSFVWDGKLQFDYKDSNQLIENVHVNDIIEIVFNKNIVNYSINDISKPTISFQKSVFTCSDTMKLFRASAANFGETRVYYCKIYDNDTLVRDFVPARRLSDNVLGLWDKVNNVFYTNAGTGTFIAGPETYETIYGNCTVCPPNTYKDTVGDFPCTPCPSTTFSKSGSTSINDCGHVMHVGDKIYFLNSQKLTSPALHVRMPDGTIYYGSLYSEME